VILLPLLAFPPHPPDQNPPARLPYAAPVDSHRRIRFAKLPTKGGAVAQLGERLNGIQEVDGSTPFSSTKKGS
jgi:hypothetical protein